MTEGSRAKLAKEGIPGPELHKMMKNEGPLDLQWKERLASRVSKNRHHLKTPSRKIKEYPFTQT